ncbi:hypothetical protein C8J56DRAFT_1058822 [Mycena floridula]|nr:hypothetical protein C8J56DRAFT_1058822 [Mycena floridula]
MVHLYLDAFADAGGAHNEAEGWKAFNQATCSIKESLNEMPSADSGKVYFMQGAFSKVTLRRGDLILAEQPLMRFSDDCPTNIDVRPVVERFSLTAMVAFLSLHNSQPISPRQPDCFTGICATNAFASGGIGWKASRSNHSCCSNARSSWYVTTGCQGIYALKTFLPAKRLLTVHRWPARLWEQSELKKRDLARKFGFICKCSACGVDEEIVAPGQDSSECHQGFASPSREIRRKRSRGSLCHSWGLGFSEISDEDGI